MDVGIQERGGCKCGMWGSGAVGCAVPLSPTPCRGPKYHLLAHTVLSLAEVQDGFRTHDLAIACNGEHCTAGGGGQEAMGSCLLQGGGSKCRDGVTARGGGGMSWGSCLCWDSP